MRKMRVPVDMRLGMGLAALCRRDRYTYWYAFNGGVWVGAQGRKNTLPTKFAKCSEANHLPG